MPQVLGSILNSQSLRLQCSDQDTGCFSPILRAAKPWLTVCIAVLQPTSASEASTIIKAFTIAFLAAFSAEFLSRSCVVEPLNQFFVIKLSIMWFVAQFHPKTDHIFHQLSNKLHQFQDLGRSINRYLCHSHSHKCHLGRMFARLHSVVAPVLWMVERQPW